MTDYKRPRILFIDAYDSFSNNIVSLLETSLNAEVTVIKIDTPIDDFRFFVKDYAAIIAGPGPGDPHRAKDVGLFRRIWELEGENVIPVLGICLGFQSLVLAHGGRIERLPAPRHGIVRKVRSNGQSIFKGIACLETVQYHSLHATLESPRSHRSTRIRKDRTFAVHAIPEVVPLAWDCEADNLSKAQGQESEMNPNRILMAVRHKTKPFFGIQFHPESISSSSAAREVVGNWWDETCIWWREKVKMRTSRLYEKAGKLCNDHCTVEKFPTPTEFAFSKPSTMTKGQSGIDSQVIDLADLTITSICEVTGVTHGETIIFDSENHKRAEVGEFSIIGIIEPECLRFNYEVGSHEVLQMENGNARIISLREHNDDIFSFLEAFMQRHQMFHDGLDVPFWGGLMGYVAYEACLETLGIGEPVQRASASARREMTRSDLSFVFVERSIVIDHYRHIINVQSIKSNDRCWVESTSSLLSTHLHLPRRDVLPQQLNSMICRPDEEQYKASIRACQSAIRAGDSYELCLTNQAKVTTPSRLPSWPLYRRLRTVNPAPFGAYIRLGNLTILSSSPERFVRWSRPLTITDIVAEDDATSGAKTATLQFRPIKGTIARRPTPGSRSVTLAEATELLATDKERAENLMIVDLIRHDLHGVVGSGRVHVPKLMVVEEYETVYQLVSVIEGNMIINPRPLQLPPNVPNEHKQRSSHHKDITTHISSRSKGSAVCDGEMMCNKVHQNKDRVLTENVPPGVSASRPVSSPFSALPATLPPGSMTGAPKMRSCQILRSLESGPRGVYSGVIGYMDVGGGGDWSVAIRCAVRWDDSEESSGDTWTVGAGGAVTTLSTEEGEWAEMLAKLQATLRIFED